MNRGLRKLKEILRKKIIRHHILYEYNGLTHKQEPIMVNIYGTEHYIVTLLQRRGRFVSKGFIRVLKHFIFIYEDRAVELEIGEYNGTEEQRSKEKKAPNVENETPKTP